MIIEILTDLLSSLWTILRTIIPLMIVLEIFKDLKITDRIAKAIRPLTNFFTISENSGISLILGIFFGLILGAGAIIQSAKDYNIDKRSIFLVCMFLSICHAIIEDTFLFAAIGANMAVILVSRFAAAILTTFVLSRFIKKEESPLKDNEELKDNAELGMQNAETK
jgi:hypothetical protein